MSDRTAAQHLEWCKERARAYVRLNALPQAMTSMLSDIRKHPKTDRVLPPHVMEIGLRHVVEGDAAGLSAWIEGFHV